METLSAPQRLLLLIEEILLVIEAQASEAMRPRFLGFRIPFLRIPHPAAFVLPYFRRLRAAFATLLATPPIIVPTKPATPEIPPIPVAQPRSAAGTTPRASRAPNRRPTPRAEPSAAPAEPASPNGSAPPIHFLHRNPLTRIATLDRTAYPPIRKPNDLQPPTQTHGHFVTITQHYGLRYALAKHHIQIQPSD